MLEVSQQNTRQFKDETKLVQTQQVIQTFPDQSSVTVIHQNEISRQQTLTESVIKTARIKYEHDIERWQQWCTNLNHPHITLQKQLAADVWAGYPVLPFSEVYQLIRQRSSKQLQTQQVAIELAEHYVAKQIFPDRKDESNSSSPWHQRFATQEECLAAFRSAPKPEIIWAEDAPIPLKMDETYHRALEDTGVKKMQHQLQQAIREEEMAKAEAAFGLGMEDDDMLSYRTPMQTWMAQQLQQELERRLLLQLPMDDVTIFPYAMRIQHQSKEELAASLFRHSADIHEFLQSDSSHDDSTGSNEYPIVLYDCQVSFPSSDSNSDGKSENQSNTQQKIIRISRIPIQARLLHLLPQMKANLIDRHGSLMHSFFEKKRKAIDVPLSYYPLAYQEAYPWIKPLEQWNHFYETESLNPLELQDDSNLTTDGARLYRKIMQSVTDAWENEFLPMVPWRNLKLHLATIQKRQEKEHERILLEYQETRNMLDQMKNHITE